MDSIEHMTEWAAANIHGTSNNVISELKVMLHDNCAVLATI